ncbi:uncharacterized protein LOC130648202 [Hydractinia symbiolongicarpus]|uniref:uncharacterized protein LOC130648202 n=1 Tax=Hydractinia symbiolongicarpus TaxID=13093 RepID=UPI00254EF20C|nr:uncharacterized protein LOC130648202 [Hydractinia symbiolongicarpus]
MKESECTKPFPKQFNDGTVINVDGYPMYHRPYNGRTVRIRNFDVDNRWVVPYNPFLCKKYMAHINLEACVSIKSVKYLYKSIYKGYDTAYIEINERIDHEVTTFLDARYVSAPEATWRLCEFPMHTQSHSITRLPVHLPNYQQVFFRKGNKASIIIFYVTLLCNTKISSIALSGDSSSTSMTKVWGAKSNGLPSRGAPCYVNFIWIYKQTNFTEF